MHNFVTDWCAIWTNSGALLSQHGNVIFHNHFSETGHDPLLNESPNSIQPVSYHFLPLHKLQDTGC